MKARNRTALAAALALASAQLAAADVVVVHGINGLDLGLADAALPVDISISDQCLQDLSFGDIDSSVELDAGIYVAQVHLADATEPCAGTLVATTSVDVSLDENLTIIAHLSAEGTPKIAKFSNDVRPATDTGGARLMVHHGGPAGGVRRCHSIWVSRGQTRCASAIVDCEQAPRRHGTIARHENAQCSSETNPSAHSAPRVPSGGQTPRRDTV